MPARPRSGTDCSLPVNGRADGPARSSQSKLADETGAVMLNLEEVGILDGRLVDAERPHDPQGGCALERPDEAGVAIEEVRLGHPPGHLAGIEEEAAGMRVRGPEKMHRDAQDGTGELGDLV